MTEQQEAITVGEWEYKVHEAARLMPEMSKKDFTTLRDDIRANGPRRPTLGIKDSDEILDGRNRLRICAELNIEPVIEWKPLSKFGDPVARVMSRNLTGPTLTTSQRAMIANRLRKMFVALPGHGVGTTPQDRKSAARAAKALKVGTTLVKATVVQEQAPEP
jgi:hypothetical protein